MLRTTNMSREWGLLLACAKARALDEPLDSAAITDPGTIDWRAFADVADEQGMTAIVADVMHASSALPETTIAAQLRQRASSVARNAVQHTQEMTRLATRFRANDIDALFYKGPIMALLAYGNIALRDYSDLDVVIEPTSLVAARALLESSGYTPIYDLTPAQDAAFAKVDGDYPFRRDDGLLVELHCRVSSERFGVQLHFAELMSRSITVDVLGIPVRTLEHTDHALVLCVHGCKHEWQRLEWIVSLAAIVRTRSIDLVELLLRADRLHARRNVLLALGLAARLLDVQLTPAVAQALAVDSKLQRLIERAAHNLVGNTPASTAARMLFNMKSKDSLRDRLTFAYRWLLLPTLEDWKAVRISDRFASLYGIVRPLRLATRGLRRAP